MNYVATMIYHVTTRSFIGVLKVKGPPVVRGRWNFVGGKIEEGEKPHDAHVREALEETGIDLNAACTYLNNVTLKFRSGVTVYFSRYDVTGPLRPTLPATNDIGERLKWVSTELSDYVVDNLYWLTPLLLDAELTAGLVYMDDGQ